MAVFRTIKRRKSDKPRLARKSGLPSSAIILIKPGNDKLEDRSLRLLAFLARVSF